MTEVLDETWLDPEVLCAESILSTETYTMQVVRLLGVEAEDAVGVARDVMLLVYGEYNQGVMANMLGVDRLSRAEAIIRSLKLLDLEELRELVILLAEQIGSCAESQLVDDRDVGRRERHDPYVPIPQKDLFSWTTAELLCEQVEPRIREGDREIPPSYAKRICGLCTVSAECLRYALDERVQEGVWGGRTALERQLIREREEAIGVLGGRVEFLKRALIEQSEQPVNESLATYLLETEEAVRRVFRWRRKGPLTIDQRVRYYCARLEGESTTHFSREYDISSRGLNRLFDVMESYMTSELRQMLIELDRIFCERDKNTHIVPQWSRHRPVLRHVQRTTG